MSTTLETYSLTETQRKSIACSLEIDGRTDIAAQVILSSLTGDMFEKWEIVEALETELENAIAAIGMRALLTFLRQ